MYKSEEQSHPALYQEGQQFLEELCLVFSNHEPVYRIFIEPILAECDADYKMGLYLLSKATRLFYAIIPEVLQEYKGMFQYMRKLTLKERLQFAGTMAENFTEDYMTSEFREGKQDESVPV